MLFKFKPCVAAVKLVWSSHCTPTCEQAKIHMILLLVQPSGRCSVMVKGKRSGMPARCVAVSFKKLRQLRVDIIGLNTNL